MCMTVYTGMCLYMRAGRSLITKTPSHRPCKATSKKPARGHKKLATTYFIHTQCFEVIIMWENNSILKKLVHDVFHMVKIITQMDVQLLIVHIRV